MANTTITALPAATTPLAGTEVVPIVQGGVTKKVAVSNIGGGSGTVTSVSVATANGLAGTVATSTTTPAITLSTTVTGVLKGSGSAISAATAGTDYLAPPSGTSILKGNSGGALANAVANTDYQSPIALTTVGTSGAATFNGTTLNIPNYTSGGGSGTVTSVGISAPAFLSVGGSPVTSSGTLALTYSGTALPVANGGTGATSATAAFDALAPSQTGNSGKYLTTNGATTSWATVSGGGSPAGSDTQVQYNSGGSSFGASSAFTFASGTGVVTATGFAGALNGTVGASTPTTGIFTTATARSTAVQDFVALQGRAGGTNSYGVTLTPTTLTASRTLTLPDASGTILQTGTTVTVGQGGTGAITLTGILKGNGTSAFTAATAGTDYSAGTSALATGIVKSTTSTGALSIAVANTDYQSPITLTTVGSSGAATFNGTTLNIPVYTGGGSSGPILESYQTISSNYSVTAGSNAFSVGPVSVATGVAVTVPTGQVWLIAA
jgi:hypothetical protein